MGMFQVLWTADAQVMMLKILASIQFLLNNIDYAARNGLPLHRSRVSVRDTGISLLDLGKKKSIQDWSCANAMLSENTL